MGTSSFGSAAVLVSLALSGCAFDSLADSAGGASLGGDDTSGTGADEDSSKSTSGGSASASGSGSTTATTTDPESGMSASDPTSASNTNPTSESESASNTNANTESQSASESESATSQGTDATDSATTDPSTSGMVEDPYPPCPMGNECPATHECLQYTVDGELAFSICVPTGCAGSGECPEPTSGNASPVCVGGAPMFCTLDCAGDTEGCPDGMDCRYVVDFGVWRCLWPV